MKILIAGSNGQLGWELNRTCPDEHEIISLDYPGIDISDNRSVIRVLNKYQPDWIINCAAYNNVDKAETDEAQAHAVNCEGAANLARGALEINARMVHISTDFVFNGNTAKPWRPNDMPDPCSVYGKTKLDGERSAQNILKNEALIIRTAWLYSAHGNNFVHTIIRLMKEKDTLNVIDDQIGTPCWAKGLAMAVWEAIKFNLKGIFHWTDAGVASWYDFAVAIGEQAFSAGLIEKEIPVIPIPSEKYPTPAKRPKFSVLDKTSFTAATGMMPKHWRKQLCMMIKEIS